MLIVAGIVYKSSVLIGMGILIGAIAVYCVFYILRMGYYFLWG
jgi:hypothetical protein